MRTQTKHVRLETKSQYYLNGMMVPKQNAKCSSRPERTWGQPTRYLTRVRKTPVADPSCANWRRLHMNHKPIAEENLDLDECWYGIQSTLQTVLEVLISKNTDESLETRISKTHKPSEASIPKDKNLIPIHDLKVQLNMFESAWIAKQAKPWPHSDKKTYM